MSLTTINSNNIFQDDVIGNVRQAQEDSHGMAENTPNGDVFVVCDGMGGHANGEKASSLAVQTIIECLKAANYGNPLEALNVALQLANNKILDYATDHPQYRGMGTTACILLLQEDAAYIAHVGDSRIYLYLGREKKLHRLTKDHSFVQTLVDLPDGHPEKISDAQAENHPNKNRILKALGIKRELHPTFNYQNSPILPKNGDVFLLCTDGLNGEISDKTMQRILSEKKTIEQKGSQLINAALLGENGQGGGSDNITVALIQIDNAPKNRKKSVFESFNPVKRKRKRKRKRGRKVGNLKKVVQLTVGAVVLLAVVAFGVLYFIGNSNRNAEIAPIQTVINKKILQIDSVTINIGREESRLENVQRVRQRTEDAGGRVAHFDEQIEQINSTLRGFENRRLRYDSILIRRVSEKDSITSIPFWKFIKPNRK